MPPRTAAWPRCVCECVCVCVCVCVQGGRVSLFCGCLSDPMCMCALIGVAVCVTV